MSGAQLFIREDLGLTGVQVEVLTGSMNLFMLVSILAAGWAADILGRRGTLVLANAFLMAGALAMSMSTSYGALLAARFVTNIAVGVALAILSQCCCASACASCSPSASHCRWSLPPASSPTISCSSPSQA